MKTKYIRMVALAGLCGVVLAGILVAAPATVTQTAAAVGKNLPPYNRDKLMNDGISDVTTIDLPAVISNLNEIVGTALPTNVVVTIVNTYGYTETNVVFSDITQAVRIINVVTSTATVTPQPGW